MNWGKDPLDQMEQACTAISPWGRKAKKGQRGVLIIPLPLLKLYPGSDPWHPGKHILTLVCTHRTPPDSQA